MPTHSSNLGCSRVVVPAACLLRFPEACLCVRYRRLQLIILARGTGRRRELRSAHECQRGVRLCLGQTPGHGLSFKCPPGRQRSYKKPNEVSACRVRAPTANTLRACRAARWLWTGARSVSWKPTATRTAKVSTCWQQCTQTKVMRTRMEVGSRSMRNSV